MKKTSSKLAAAGLAAAGFALLALSAHAADSYQSSLQAGDDLRGQGHYDQALFQYTTAIGQAATPTERSLALGKKATVYAYNTKDYTQAKQFANDALAIPDVKPVAEVTALQALAEAQVKGDKNYTAAANNLMKAAALEGVEWAKPTVTLALGDAYRLSNDHDSALDAYQKVLDMPGADGPLKAVAHLNRGFIYQYARKNYDQARSAYRSAAQLNPSLAGEIDGHLAKMP